MLKFILAKLRWGKLTKEQKEELKTLPFSEVCKRPFLAPKLHKHY